MVAEIRAPAGAPAAAAAASMAVIPGSTRMSSSRQSAGPASNASNTAEAMAKTPGSPDETTTTRRPSAAIASAWRERSSSTRLSDGCRVSPSRGATRAT